MIQKRDVLISIKPQFVEEIISGNKLFEFRKRICCSEKVNKVYIYSSSPMKKIIGSFDLETILEGTPDEIWEKCKDGAGISKEYFMEYYKDKEKAFALKIDNLDIFDEYISPYETKSNFTAPQSYMYLNTSLESFRIAS